jgi:hypothetical protein
VGESRDRLDLVTNWGETLLHLGAQEIIKKIKSKNAMNSKNKNMIG